MTCPKCGFENPESSTECVDCGVIFSRMAGHVQSPGVGVSEYRSIGESIQPTDSNADRITDSLDEAGPGEITGVLLLGDDREVNPFYFWGRVVAVVLILLYSWTFITYPLEPNAGHSFLHNVDLVFHEAGHIKGTDWNGKGQRRRGDTHTSRWIRESATRTRSPS